MVATSNDVIKDRDKFYYRQRNKNRVFEKIVSQFAQEAERNGITKKQLAERLKADPAQITRWLSVPGNLTLDSVSDLLLALGAEMDYEVTKFEDRKQPNYMHSLVSQIVHEQSIVMPTSNKSSAVAMQSSQIAISSGNAPIKFTVVSSG